MKGNKQVAMPFSGKLILLGIFGGIFTMIIDIPWPVIEVFGFRQILGLFIFGGFMFLILIGFVLGMVAGTAARKGRKTRASNADNDGDADADALDESSSPSPVGEVVLPKQSVEQSIA